MSVTTTPASPPATVPASSVIPFPMAWSGMGGGAPLPGCCPPGGMDALMKCYCDIQQTLAFMSKIMVDLMTHDPAVQAAMIAGIQQSGSNLPLIGVTNGTDAQPGQVGEWVQFAATVAYAGSGSAVTTSTSMGVLNPGDWDIWIYGSSSTFLLEGEVNLLSPVPAGFTGNLYTIDFSPTGASAATVCSSTERALISTQTLIVIQTTLAANTAGSFSLYFKARRRR